MLDDVIDKVESAQKDVKTDNKMHFIDASDDKHDADDSKPRFYNHDYMCILLHELL